MKVLTTEQMRELEESCARDGLTTEILMENAGRAVAEEISEILDGVEQRQILFLIGPGNNGGDGLVAARHLHDQGAKVIIYFCGDRPTRDPMMRPIRERRITRVKAVQDEDLEGLSEFLASSDAVIDALFGTGTTRPLGGLLAMVLSKVQRAKKKRAGLRIIALDLPSGLNADTGEIDPACLHADNTVTLAFPKPGLLKLPGSERAGKVSVVDIGMPDYMAEEAEVSGYIPREWVQSVLPKRSPQANKGSFGSVLVVAGSINYIGAAYLACNGAMRVGAGLVTLATTGRLQSILASKLTEVIYLPLPESRPGLPALDAVKLIFRQAGQYDVLLLGCGMGQSEPVVKVIKTLLLAKSRPTLPSLVLDADALNTLATFPEWWRRLTDDAILTPHPGEMARLTGMTVDEVQADRSGIAQKMAAEWNKTIVLKGAHTVVAEPSGQTRVSHVANAGLASAGTGDVLAGAIAGMVAQGLSLFDAAACGVYLHGMAGEMVKARMGDAGMIASDLLPELPQAIRRLKED